MKAASIISLGLAVITAGAGAGTITISEVSVDKTVVRPGEAFTIAVAASGGANYCLRQNRFGRPALPGWKEHGPDYAFLPSIDFTGAGPYKNPVICHQDNGARDTDPREGVFRVKVDTTGWPEGVYEFQAMATNRPAVGAYVGDACAVEITVTENPSTVSQGIRPRFDIAVNGRQWTKASSGQPILPGRANRMTVRTRDDEVHLPLDVSLVCIHPDGRKRRVSATLTANSPAAELDLGLFAVPPAFDFEAGVLYRRGARLRLEIAPRGGEPLETIHFFQTIGEGNQREVLALGDKQRVPHFGGRPAAVRPLDPPILLWLAPEVLSDIDDVRVCLQLRSREKRIDPTQSLNSIDGKLRVTADGEEPVFEQDVTVRPEVSMQRLDVSEWEEGRYRVEFVPTVDGTADHHGPVVVYRKREAAPDAVRLSPLAPWTLERDQAREEVVIDDFRKAVAMWSDGLPDDETWEFRETAAGGVSLLTPPGDWRRPPVILRPGLERMYAVFADAEKENCFLRIGADGDVRGLAAETSFVDVADLTSDQIAIYPAAVAGSGLRELRLVPVTAASVSRFRKATANPPVRLRGVADWCDYFAPPDVHHSAGMRLAPDQLDMLLAGHGELGMRSIAWAIGRSWVEYHSTLPTTTRFPCRPLETIDPKFQHKYAGRTAMVNNQDPLAHVLRQRTAYRMKILPWLSMQRHYGENAYGGIFCSEWFRTHPEWRRWSKGASGPSGSTVSYYFPEVRKERVDIFCEVAARNPDGLVIGWCRQVPMILYHPEMVAEYRAKTGVDPLKIDASDEEAYGQWIRWRADFVTETLRELKTRLAPIRESTGRAIPVVVRIPSKGLFYNMAQGLDVETWCREKLIHGIQLDPLEDCGWRGEPHDVRPYLALGHRCNLPVFGGINGNTFWNPTAILRRALGLLEAGVDGIEIYESNNFAAISPRRWMIPLLGNAQQLEQFLRDSNLDAVHPLWSRTVTSGYDNHSFGGRWSVYGMGGNSL